MSSNNLISVSKRNIKILCCLQTSTETKCLLLLLSEGFHMTGLFTRQFCSGFIPAEQNLKACAHKTPQSSLVTKSDVCLSSCLSLCPNLLLFTSCYVVDYSKFTVSLSYFFLLLSQKEYPTQEELSVARGADRFEIWEQFQCTCRLPLP